MTPEEIDLALQAWAEDRPLVRRIWVFGSRARGEERDDSDIDVAVEIFHHDESEGLATWMFETNDWKGELAGLFPFKVDLQQYQGQRGTPTIHAALDRSSRLVVDRT